VFEAVTAEVPHSGEGEYLQALVRAPPDQSLLLQRHSEGERLVMVAEGGVQVAAVHPRPQEGEADVVASVAREVELLQGREASNVIGGREGRPEAFLPLAPEVQAKP